MNDGTGSENRRPSRTEQVPTDDDSLFDRVKPEALRRGLESLLGEGRLRSFVGELKLPKEIASHILSQVDETKHAALEVVSREVRLFLERTNLADELAKLLTQISFEVTTQVRFIPNDKAVGKKGKGLIETILHHGADRSEEAPPPAPPAPAAEEPAASSEEPLTPSSPAADGAGAGGTPATPPRDSGARGANGR